MCILTPVCMRPLACALLCVCVCACVRVRECARVCVCVSVGGEVVAVCVLAYLCNFDECLFFYVKIYVRLDSCV